jgi:predicted enzyme related to lactoylglutathione lyase
VIGAPCWIDLLSSDGERSRDFYTGLLGWTATDPDPQHGGYVVFSRDGLMTGGAMARQEGMQGPDGWNIYLAVENARATVELAKGRGAKVIVEPMDVADLGTMAVILDPSGAAIGLWQAGTHKGFGIVYEPNAPAWFELHTTQYDACLDFYRAVFGWTTQALDTPQFRYTVLQIGEMQYCGVIDETAYAPADSPSYWLTYFGVEDTDATLRKVRELGGTVTRDAEDTPYGRLASVTDPTGASFNVSGPNVGAATGATAGQASA